MTRKPKRDPKWTPFVEIPVELFIERLRQKGLVHHGNPFDTPTAIFENSRYQVAVHTFPPGTWPEVNIEVKQLSIKRLDKREVKDWRDFQRIKTELLGPEVEACELYPAESRLVDTANQYHLWCLAPGQWFPFGYFDGRLVAGPSNPGGFEPSGSRQRPFEDPVDETIAPDKLDAAIRLGRHEPTGDGDNCDACGLPKEMHRWDD